MLKQKTLKDSFSLSGKGLHTGLDLTVTFNPAPDNHGYKIQRIDVEGQPTIDAVADNVTETTRGTVLSKNGVKVSTIEHGMAALYALGIDNCLIQVNGPEFPILDGSAQYYVQEIERVGTVEQNAVKDFFECSCHMSAFEQVVIDKDSTVAFLIVESAALLDIDCHEPGGRHHEHGDKPGELPQRDREHDESYERHSYGCRRKCKEASPDSHELQRFL